MIHEWPIVVNSDMEPRDIPISAWFAGPKSENGEAFTRTIRRILEDNQYWRRNYFPEDGVIITSEERRRHSAWSDVFEDKLMELLAALKSDCPFQSPRYAAHMVAFGVLDQWHVRQMI